MAIQAKSATKAVIPTICILCGIDASTQRQRPVPIARIEFRPFIGGEEPGQDNVIGAVCCQDCYAKVLGNRAKAIGQYGRIKETEKK
jgi:hypothetical protein